MSEYIVKGAEPNETVLHSRTPNGYESWNWLPVLERIVRCRDCKHFAIDHTGTLMYGETVCWVWKYVHDYPHYTDPNGFCYRGERRDV